MRIRLILLLAIVVMAGSPLSAKVTKIEIQKREVLLNGKTFGEYGEYEYLSGRIWFEVDPGNVYNSRITDIHFAELNKNGLVEAVANFEVLQPVSRELSRGVAIVEVSNRGGKASLRYFNRSTGRGSIDPEIQDHFGDELLMRQGLTVIWVGWQFDVPTDENILKLIVPEVLSPDGKPVSGLVRSDWTVDEAVKTLGLGHRMQTGYPVADPDDQFNTLYVRDSREGTSVEVDKSIWRFGTYEDGQYTPGTESICSAKGFEAGKIYELVYVSEKAVVVGMGLAAIRDIISYSKFDPDCPFPTEKGLAVGVSQTGRFLRHFLYQGFNTDESGRMAFDGMMIITAGAGRGSFNHRFGQPSRDAHRYSAFFYPTDIFPFTSRVVSDDEQWRSDGLLAHMWNDNHIPKIFYCNTGYEYWGRAASLIHIDPDGLYDIEPLPNERIYLLASGQHYVGPQPTERNRLGETMIYRGNPLDYSVNYRSLLVRLAAWVDNDTEPPANAFPRISDGSLVDLASLALPVVKDLKLPAVAHVAYIADYGPRWSDGIIDYQPPYLTKPFPTLVPAVDKIGNDMAGIRNVEVAVPLASYFPWNLRTGFIGGEDELTDFTGTFVPLQFDKSKGYQPDTRHDIISLYSDFDDYMLKVGRATTQLVRGGYVLEEDIDYIRSKAEARWKWVVEQ
jgi:hypothetical protein